MKTILSGIKPTGKPHLGNYFGYFRQMINLQNEYNTFAMIADYHALNFIQNANEMRELTKEVVIDFLALGFDTEKNALFKQSDVPEHTELCWIFDTIMSVPYLKRAHAYKDAVEKGEEEKVSMGTFNYPMLMAADILLYSPDIVPVGQDQKQHIEFARDTAEKFNRIYGNPPAGGFKLPEAYIMKDVEVVPGIDGRKMSKSYDNYISLFAEDDEIEEKVMAIVTDSGPNEEQYKIMFDQVTLQNPNQTFYAPLNVYMIHKLIRTESELRPIYEKNKGQYKKLKEILIEDLKKFIAPLREKRAEIAKNPEIVSKVLDSGKERARAVASPKLAEVKRALGVAT